MLAKCYHGSLKFTIWFKRYYTHSPLPIIDTLSQTDNCLCRYYIIFFVKYHRIFIRQTSLLQVIINWIVKKKWNFFWCVFYVLAKRIWNFIMECLPPTWQIYFLFLDSFHFSHLSWIFNFKRNRWQSYQHSTYLHKLNSTSREILLDILTHYLPWSD